MAVDGLLELAGAPAGEGLLMMLAFRAVQLVVMAASALYVLSDLRSARAAAQVGADRHQKPLPR